MRKLLMSLLLVVTAFLAVTSSASAVNQRLPKAGTVDLVQMKSNSALDAASACSLAKAAYTGGNCGSAAVTGGSTAGSNNCHYGSGSQTGNNWGECDVWYTVVVPGISPANKFKYCESKAVYQTMQDYNDVTHEWFGPILTIRQGWNPNPWRCSWANEWYKSLSPPGDVNLSKARLDTERQMLAKCDIEADQESLGLTGACASWGGDCHFTPANKPAGQRNLADCRGGFVKLRQNPIGSTTLRSYCGTKTYYQWYKDPVTNVVNSAKFIRMDAVACSPYTPIAQYDPSTGNEINMGYVEDEAQKNLKSFCDITAGNLTYVTDPRFPIVVFRGECQYNRGDQQNPYKWNTACYSPLEGAPPAPNKSKAQCDLSFTALQYNEALPAPGNTVPVHQQTCHATVKYVIIPDGLGPSSSGYVFDDHTVSENGYVTDWTCGAIVDYVPPPA